MSVIDEVSTCCPAPLDGPLSDADAERVAAALKVVADPARLRLLSFLGVQPDQTACVCELVPPAGLSQPTVSHHLKVLHEAGFLDRERRGQWVYYRLVPESLAVLRDVLTPPAQPRRARGRRR